MIKGLYRYELPEKITKGIEGITLDSLPDNYESCPDKDSYSVLIVRQGLVTKTLLDTFSNIKWLQLLNSGYEQIDLDLLRKKNMLFTNARSAYCRTIAEDVIAKMLVLARNYPNHIINQTKGQWIEPADNIDLSGKKLGILGAGSIGSEIAKRAAAFEMETIGYDPFVKERNLFGIIYHDTEGLKKLCNSSDFIVLCLPVTELTKNIMNKEIIKEIKRGAFLINVSRGDVLDEEAFMEGVNSHIIGGAYLDVCKEEPLSPESPLWWVPNIYITPHQAAYGDLMKERMTDLIEKNIRQYLLGKPLFDTVKL
jgi:phosphoglycerate dehydrogenase-like enzyme